MKRERPTRVLVAEDDFLVGKMVKGLLAKIGYTVAGLVTNGLEAVTMTQTLAPDVVLMDIEMPDLNGIEAARRISETVPTPIVVLTAYETSELVEQASQAGVGAYLIKPPNIKELERAITIALARFDDMLALRQLNELLEARNKALEQALDQVATLSGLLPICATCKKIRDDHGYWHQVEAYISSHSQVRFSHGICPDCLLKYYPDLEGGKTNKR